MENELKNKSRHALVIEVQLIAVVSITILFLVFVGIFATTGSFFPKLILCVFLFIAFITALYSIKELIFIKKAHLTFGTVIRIDKSDPNESQAYQNYIVEYIDEATKHTEQTIVYELFGDNDEECVKKIQEFYDQGQELIGKRVPLLYITNVPKKTKVFLNDAESSRKGYSK